MEKSKKMKKGQHERSMEEAKEMLDKGYGMGEIVEVTNLAEKDITKAKSKWIDRS
jgi:hypothetical protein